MGGRRTVFSRRTGSLWPSAGAAMRGMAREYAAGNARGPGWREFAGTFGCAVGSSVSRLRRQAGSGMARSRAKARVNWDSQGQRGGRCRVRRRAERVIRPAREKTRRASLPQGLGGHHLLTQTGPRCPTGRGYAPSPGPPARRRWRRNAPTACGSARRRT